MRLMVRLGTATLLAATTSALAQTSEQPRTESSAFTLGQIIVTARPVEGIAIRSATLNAEAIYTFNRNSLDDACMADGGSQQSFGSRA